MADELLESWLMRRLSLEKASRSESAKCDEVTQGQTDITLDVRQTETEDGSSFTFHGQTSEEDTPSSSESHDRHLGHEQTLSISLELLLLDDDEPDFVEPGQEFLPAMKENSPSRMPDCDRAGDAQVAGAHAPGSRDTKETIMALKINHGYDSISESNQEVIWMSGDDALQNEVDTFSEKESSFIGGNSDAISPHNRLEHSGSVEFGHEPPSSSCPPLALEKQEVKSRRVRRRGSLWDKIADSIGKTKQDKSKLDKSSQNDKDRQKRRVSFADFGRSVSVKGAARSKGKQGQNSRDRVARWSAPAEYRRGSTSQVQSIVDDVVSNEGQPDVPDLFPFVDIAKYKRRASSFSPSLGDDDEVGGATGQTPLNCGTMYSLYR